MTCNKLLKLFITISFIFVAPFHLQPFLATDGEEENGNMPTRGMGYLHKGIEVVADSMDSLSSPIQQSSSFFFPTLPEDITTTVFLHLYKKKRDINNFISVSLTCQYGYRLMQNSIFWNLLKDVYFSHLPGEYRAVLLQDTKDNGLKLCGTLFGPLLTYQEDEIRRLSQMLSRLPAVTGPEESSILINNIDKDTKQKWLTRLELPGEVEKTLNELEYEDGLALTKNPAFQRYVVLEKTLDSINSEIIEKFFDFMKIQILKNRKIAQIRLQCSITRLPKEGVECIKSILLRDNINDVVLDLSYNCLRWLPDELFSIKEITLLKLMNNLLCYLPETIENTRDHLTSLQLGNYDSFNPLLTNRHSRRTSGNIFKMVPPAIFKLNKLTDLDMKSVQLGEFPESELYEALPMLSALNVAHNDLSSVPEGNFQDRRIIVMNHDNPGSSPLPLYQRIGDCCFDMGVRYVNWPSEAMNFFSRHPIGCVFGFIALWPTVFIGTLYLEHGSLLWGGSGGAGVSW